MAFNSYASNLVAGDTNGFGDIFVRDTQTGTTTRISLDSVGTQGNNDSNAPSISADGQYVAFFSDASNLVAGDTNGTTDTIVTPNISSSSTSFSLSLLAGMSIATQQDARDTLDALDTYFQEVATLRGTIGSALSRFEVAAHVLGTSSENVQAAESRITDADVAEEAAGLTRRSILQQAGAAVLAQASKQPAVALQLLSR